MIQKFPQINLIGLNDRRISIFEIIPDSTSAVDTALEEDIHHIPRFPIDNSFVDVDELNIVENRLQIRR